MAFIRNALRHSRWPWQWLLTDCPATPPPPCADKLLATSFALLCSNRNSPATRKRDTAKKRNADWHKKCISIYFLLSEVAAVEDLCALRLDAPTGHSQINVERKKGSIYVHLFGTQQLGVKFLTNAYTINLWLCLKWKETEAADKMVSKTLNKVGGPSAKGTNYRLPYMLPPLETIHPNCCPFPAY